MSNRTLVQETCNNPGTGTTVNLLGAVASRRSFASSYSSGQTCFYVLSDGLLSEWGIGTFTSGSPNTLARTTVIGNSAGTTARLNFTGITNVYNAVPGEYSVFQGSHWGFLAGGTANARTITISAPITGYVAGQEYSFVNGASANTGATTLAINGLTATNILKGASALAAGDLPASALVTVRYDGSTFRLVAVEPAGIGVPLSRVADATAARVLINAAPAPTASVSTVGQWVEVGSADGADLVLPSGGTWAYLYLNFTTSNVFQGRAAGVAAGGSTIVTGVPGFYFTGFAWRIA